MMSLSESACRQFFSAAGVRQALCTLAVVGDTREERAAAAMTAAAQALKPRPGRRVQQQRPPSPPRAASPAAGAALAASTLPGHPCSGAAAAAAAGQGAHLPAAVATFRAVPTGLGNLDGFLPPESRPWQQVGSAM